MITVKGGTKNSDNSPITGIGNTQKKSTLRKKVSNFNDNR